MIQIVAFVFFLWHDLANVQRARELPTRLIQRVQTYLQDQVFAKTLKADPTQPVTFPPLVGVILRTPGLRLLPARLMGVDLWRVLPNQFP